MVAKKTVLAGQTPQCAQIFREIEEELYNFFQVTTNVHSAMVLRWGRRQRLSEIRGVTPKDRPKNDERIMTPL